MKIDMFQELSLWTQLPQSLVAYDNKVCCSLILWAGNLGRAHSTSFSDSITSLSLTSRNPLSSTYFVTIGTQITNTKISSLPPTATHLTPASSFTEINASSRCTTLLC